MSEKFVNIDRETPMLLPVDMREWLPEDHLVHFVIEVVGSMDLWAFSVNGRGTGSAQYPPSMLLALLVYCYATGRFSSRVIEQASYYDLAVRYICADTHPDHDTICTFRRRNRKAFERFFTHVLEVAAQSGAMKKVGTVSVDGTKVKASASKHSAVSYKRAQQMVARLEQEVAALTERAEQADGTKESACETSLPEEIRRREDRKAKISEAIAVIEARHKEKLAQEKEAYEAKVAKRKERRERGERVGGKEPKAPCESVPAKAQYNFTDPQSRIMKAGSGKHFEQAYNAQAAVEVESMLIVSNHVSDNANDKGELTRALEGAKEAGFEVEKALADTGYYSEKAVEEAGKEGIETYIALGRQGHGYTLEKILGEEEQEAALLRNAGPKERMAHKLKSKEGAKLYALRKQTVEPAFGIIKQCMRFRRFLMRGKERVSLEWNLVCSAYNMKRLFNLTRKREGGVLASKMPKPA